MSDQLSRRQWLARSSAAIAAAAVGLRANVALAHRSHVTLTQLAAHPVSGRWEIVHAIHYHDALRLLALRGAKTGAQPGNASGNAYIALEIERNLRWFAPNGATLQLATVGAELRGDNVLVYQESAPPATRGTCAVESTLMHDVFADARNNISIEFKRPFTLIGLTRQSRRATFEFGG